MKLINSINQKIQQIISRPSQVFVEIRGRELVLAEGYCRIELYSEECVILRSSQSQIQISGENLNLQHLSDERVAVEGRINGIEFL